MHTLTHNEKSAQSDLVFEGKVISQNSAYNDAGAIYTSNKIELTGDNSHTVEVITPGGIVGDKAQIHFPGLTLQVGEQGKFYCTEKNGKYYPVALSQGFEPYQAAEVKSGAVQVSNISPLNITAGTQDIITITGTGFGTVQGNGRVSFRNADNGGTGWVTIQPGPHYTMWTNTMIKLYLPSYTQSGVTVAGSGNVKVTTSTGESVQSEQQISVQYALSELVYNGQIGKITLAAVDNNEGYSMRLSSFLLQNTEAVNALKRAMSTWRCNTGINVSIDTVNYIQTITSYNDGYSSISFDEQGLLPQGALASTVISVSACSNEGVMNWQLSEVDIIFSSSALWNIVTGLPFPNHFDFESVALHELGHMHLEQHNNNTESIMYYRLNSGETKRNLFSDNGLDGGIEVMQRSVDPGYSCSNFENIVPVNNTNCSMVGIKDNASGTEEQVTVFPNPSPGNFTLNWGDFSTGQIQINIINQVGALVHSELVASQSSATLNLSLAAGIYIVELQGKEKTAVRKISIQ